MPPHKFNTPVRYNDSPGNDNYSKHLSHRNDNFISLNTNALLKKIMDSYRDLSSQKFEILN